MDNEITVAVTESGIEIRTKNVRLAFADQTICFSWETLASLALLFQSRQQKSNAEVKEVKNENS